MIGVRDVGNACPPHRRGGATVPVQAGARALVRQVPALRRCANGHGSRFRRVLPRLSASEIAAGPLPAPGTASRETDVPAFAPGGR